MSEQTWVCGWDDGSEEQAVGKEEISVQLPHLLHQRHAAVHQQPEGEREPSDETAATPQPTECLGYHRIWILPRRDILTR